MSFYLPDEETATSYKRKAKDDFDSLEDSEPVQVKKVRNYDYLPALEDASSDFVFGFQDEDNSEMPGRKVALYSSISKKLALKRRRADQNPEEKVYDLDVLSIKMRGLTEDEEHQMHARRAAIDQLGYPLKSEVKQETEIVTSRYPLSAIKSEPEAHVKRER